MLYTTNLNIFLLIILVAKPDCGYRFYVTNVCISKEQKTFLCLIQKL